MKYRYIKCLGIILQLRKGSGGRPQTVLDLPARPIHPSHHAPHRVPPQDGDVQVPSGVSVLDDLAVVVGSPFVDGQSAARRPPPQQLPPQARVGDDDHPRAAAFARRGNVAVADGAFGRFVAQQRGVSLLLQGAAAAAVVRLAHGRRRGQGVALAQQCRGEDGGRERPSHGEGACERRLPGGVWFLSFARCSPRRRSGTEIVSSSFIAFFGRARNGHVESFLTVAPSPVVPRKLVKSINKKKAIGTRSPAVFKSFVLEER